MTQITMAPMSMPDTRPGDRRIERHAGHRPDRHTDRHGEEPPALGPLSRHASELYDDTRLTPMLSQLIRTSLRLGDAMGGSVSLVDGERARYTKVAEIGTACRLGQSFPLNEGVTGQVLRSRAPVVLRNYGELATGHLKAGPAAQGAVAAIPVWWRADIVAVNVVFAGVARPFTVDEVDRLELVTQIVAAGLVSAVDRELPGSSVRRAATHAEVAAAGAAISSVNDVVSGLIELTQRATSGDARPLSDLEVRVVGDATRPRLLFRPDQERGSSPGAAWHELVDSEDGVVAVRPAESGADGDGHPSRSTCPLSAREQQVAALLAEGRSDRGIASVLFLSPKTVEKHVSAVLRKTGTTSRTAAAVLCLDQGWV